MNRRDVIRGAAGSAGALGVGVMEAGCAHQASAKPAATPAASDLPDQAVIDNVVKNLDRRLAWIDQHRLPKEMMPDPGRTLTPEEELRIERHTRLFRQSIRTLYVTGRFMDLPDEIKTHPDVQSRVQAALPEMDDAVFGTTEMLESLTPQDHRSIQAVLRERPQLGEQLAVLLETSAREDGIPFRRRMGVRTAALQVTQRMAAQSPALTIEPYVRRVRKIAAQPLNEQGSARLIAARIGEQAFWEHQQRLADLSGRWERKMAQTDATTPAPPATPAPAPSVTSPYPPRGPRPLSGAGAARPATPTPTPTSPGQSASSGAGASSTTSPGRRTIGRGGVIMGFGAGSVGLGVLFAGLNSAFGSEALLWPALFFGVTVGPILLLIGLLVLLVGGIQLAAAGSHPPNE